MSVIKTGKLIFGCKAFNQFAVFLILSLLLITTSCRKEVKKFDVIYEVTMPAGNIVSIDYNSDFYAATGIRKEIIYNSDSTNQYFSTVWFARRYAFEDEKFYIKVKYTNLQIKDSTYKVIVYVNDEVKAEKSNAPLLELEGDI